MVPWPLFYYLKGHAYQCQSNAYSCNLEGWMSMDIQIGIVIGMEQDRGFIIKAKQTDTTGTAGLAIVTDCISVAVAQ